MQNKAKDLNNLFKTLILDIDASVMGTEMIFQEEIKTFIEEQR